MYSHTENLITVMDRDHKGDPCVWAIVGTRDLNTRGQSMAERAYKQAIHCGRDGTRIVIR